MSHLSFRTRDGKTSKVEQDRVEDFAKRLRGQWVTPGSLEYEPARTVWNAMIDRRPTAIVRCRGAADVMCAVRFASEHDLLISVRGGGHSVAGNSVAQDGLMIDLSLMQSVRVDPAARTARVEPGVTLGGFDQEAQAFGLATPIGINSTTGISGLTLGGGFGWTSRSLGLTVDNLLSADVVTAEGTLVRASERENSDLFWGLRGGGGNFGIVTSFEFKLHPVGPQVLAGLVVHPLDAAKDVLGFYRRFVAEAPDELSCWFVMRQAPPLPFLSPDWHGKEILVLAMCYTGAIEEGERATQAIRSYGRPLADVVAPQPFVAWQTALDPLLTPGMRNYWKSHNFLRLEDGLLDVLEAGARRLPDPQTDFVMIHLGGAVSRIASGMTAYAQREAPFVMNVHGRWADPGKDDACIGWTRDLFKATQPFATGATYVNFMNQDEADRVEAVYGPNYARLAELKRKMDPRNLFSMNQNIRPS